MLVSSSGSLFTSCISISSLSSSLFAFVWLRRSTSPSTSIFELAFFNCFPPKLLARLLAYIRLRFRPTSTSLSYVPLRSRLGLFSEPYFFPGLARPSWMGSSSNWLLLSIGRRVRCFRGDNAITEGISCVLDVYNVSSWKIGGSDRWRLEIFGLKGIFSSSSDEMM